MYVRASSSESKEKTYSSVFAILHTDLLHFTMLFEGFYLEAAFHVAGDDAVHNASAALLPLPASFAFVIFSLKNSARLLR